MFLYGTQQEAWKANLSQTIKLIKAEQIMIFKKYNFFMFRISKSGI